MKRIICLLISLAMLFSLAGCKKEENNNSNPNGSEISVEEYAKKGQIPEQKFALGTDIETVKKYYSDLVAQYSEENPNEENTGHSHEDVEAYYFDVIEGEKTVRMDTGNTTFFYEKAKADKGISVISTKETAFGFVPGSTTKQEIELAFETKGKTLDATEDDMYFVIQTDSYVILRYNFENIKLDFYFTENLLMSTVIANTQNWTV